MSSVTVRECFDQLSEVITHYKTNKTQHEYSRRCIKQDIAFVSQVFNKLQMKIEEIRMNRQFQTYIDKLKPLLKAEHVQRNILENKIKLHKASKCDTVESKKLSIQHICQALGLKCVEGDDLKSYISFDANEFYLDVSFGQSSDFKSESTGAKVSLVTEGKPEDQPYIADTLIEWDFNKFQEHLKGFISIFNIPLEPRVRPILFSALRSLESDLLVMSNSPDPPTSDSINNTHTGHVIKSRGGMGIKILYFHNTALINSENKVKEKVKVKLESGTGSEVLEEESASVSIGVECSNTNQLPTQNLFIRNNEFKQLSLKVNSEYVEATFVMKLSTPLVMTVSKMNALLKKLGNNSLIKFEAVSTTFLELLLNNAGLSQVLQNKDKSLKHNKLNHVYYLPCSGDEKAVEIHRIPFSHPSQVPVIINMLRQQTVYNRLILSCHDNLPTTTTPCCHNTNQTTVDITLQPGSSIEFVFAHPELPQLCVMNMEILSQTTSSSQTTFSSQIRSQTVVNVSTSDTQKTSVLSGIASRYLSVPLTLHGILRILTHHHKNNIKPVKPKHEPKESPVISSDYDMSSVKVASPPPITPTVVKCEPMSSLSEYTPVPTDVGPMLTPPPMSQGHMPNMSSPFGPDSLKTIPSPPDIIAQKRKRPVGCDGDEALLKKPTKLVKICDSVVPSIPVLSPMSGLSNNTIRHPMRPIGPPSLKPAPIHSSSPQGGLGVIPCLSPAPRMPPRMPALQSSVPSLQSPVPALQAGIQIKSESDHDQGGEGNDSNT